MATRHLTDISIRSLPRPESGQRTYFEREGFGVRVSQGGTKTFVVMCGKGRKLHSNGRVGEISLKDARKSAKAIQIAPPDETVRKSLAAARTAFLKDADNRLRPASVANYRLYLNRLEQKNLEDVKREDVAYSAHSIMAAKAFFNWCKREKLTTHNPVEFEKVKLGRRTRVHSDTEIKALWSYEAPPFSDHIKLLLLTGQRRNQFSNYEVRGDSLFFPPEIMKGKDAHTIPLLPMAKEVLKRLQSFNGWSKCKARMDEEVIMPAWVVHDLRRTFSTNMAKLRVPLHITENILAHRSGVVSGVAAIYNLHDFLEESREALAKYEAHICSLVT